MNNDQRIAEIKARAEAATPGPWEWRCSDNNPYSIEAEALTNVIYLEDDYPGYPECGEHLIMNIETSDAEFISHAREDMPYLLGQLAERDKELERYNVPLEEFKPELIKPYLSNTSSEYVCALEGEIERLMEAQRWIAVEEALPESGVHVLLTCETRPSGGQYVCDGYYAAPKTIICGSGDDCATEYDDDKDEYYLVEGYYEVIKNWDDFSSICINDFVTHWRKLPDPPQKGAGK